MGRSKILLGPVKLGVRHYAGHGWATCLRLAIGSLGRIGLVGPQGHQLSLLRVIEPSKVLGLSMGCTSGLWAVVVGLGQIKRPYGILDLKVGPNEIGPRWTKVKGLGPSLCSTYLGPRLRIGLIRENKMRRNVASWLMMMRSPQQKFRHAWPPEP
ncbi:hypothetical protein E3N88_23246 [Mikania micrantha]|uniref:Uncharacterized protein n=1 Tax=Mikania micrantha TaxID=192012 RepID=A0A5N6NFE1_9ASTR|nr:hypothetical protein E3N88_23246 [Mikania micrantha]